MVTPVASGFAFGFFEESVGVDEVALVLAMGDFGHVVVDAEREPHAAVGDFEHLAIALDHHADGRPGPER